MCKRCTLRGVNIKKSWTSIKERLREGIAQHSANGKKQSKRVRKREIEDEKKIEKAENRVSDVKVWQKNGEIISEKN